MKNILLFFLLIVCSSQANSFTLGFQNVRDNDIDYRIFVAEPNSVHLHWKKPKKNENFVSFSSLKSYLESQSLSVMFLTNAGIYGVDNKPAGLHVEGGKTLHQLNTNSTAKGNFHLQPNGVFYIPREGQAGVMTTNAYKKYYSNNELVRLATQSGPMLLIDGKINHQFLKDGKSKHYRSGVCVVKGKVVFFKNENKPINFHQFAKFAKLLGCKNALYLDGKISKFYNPDVDFIWHFSDFVGMFSVTE